VNIGVAETDADLKRCFPIMVQLRPHLTEATYLERVGRQRREGYAVAYVDDAGAVRAVAGYRFLETLFSGPQMYVDDLVTDEAGRSKGYGGALLDWLVAKAKSRGCAEFHLDSGVHRFGAHRFYFRKGMHISSYHFKLALVTPGG